MGFIFTSPKPPNLIVIPSIPTLNTELYYRVIQFVIKSFTPAPPGFKLPLRPPSMPKLPPVFPTSKIKRGLSPGE